MARILTTAQKKAIFISIPTQITIDTTDIDASIQWANQDITSYPTISLNIASDGITAIEDVSDGILYSTATLTIHILTKNAQGFNGAIIAETFSQAIIDEITTWTTPLTGDVRIFDSHEDIASLQNNGFSDDIYDYILSITIHHG